MASFLTVFLTLTLCFFALRLLPGAPFSSTEDGSLELTRETLERDAGLTKNIFEQYVDYLGGLAKGSFGKSYLSSNQKVETLIYGHLGISMVLGGLSLICICFIGTLLGLAAAKSRLSPIMVTFDIVTSFFISLPSFVSAPLLILVFAVFLDWLPVALFDSPKHMILPILAMTLRPLSVLARLIRERATEIINSDFIRLAEAKGLSPSYILRVHVAKLVLPTTLAYLHSIGPQLLMGSFIVEVFFAIPGLGYLFAESLTYRDYPTILGVVLLYTIILQIFALVLGFMQGRLDPRVQE